VTGPVFAADLAGDGADELVQLVGGALVAYVNDGNGGFTAAAGAAAPLPVGALGFGDVDDDGRLDAVTGTFGGGNTQAAVYLGDGTGGFAEPVVHAVPSYVTDVRVVDVDADGAADPLMLGAGGEIMFLHSLGDGTLDNAAVTTIEGCLNRRDVVLDDINDDCVPDIVTVCLEGDLVHVLTSSG
jgi:hypothetical protein